MTLPENRPMRTLADYRPQHDDDCDSRICEGCDYAYDLCEKYGQEDRDCAGLPRKPCTCGLDALLGVRRDEQGLEKIKDLSRSDQPQLRAGEADLRDDQKPSSMQEKR